MIARRSYTIDAKSLQCWRTITKWSITFRAFIQATSNKRDTILENGKIFKHNDRTADQSKRVKASLPQSSSCHVVGQPFDTVVRAALFQSNRISLWRRAKESVSVPDSSDWNCAELFSFSAFCFHPSLWWNRSTALLKAMASQTGDPCGVERKRVSVYLTRQIWTVLNFSRSAIISAFIPRADETSSENHKSLSRFNF